MALKLVLWFHGQETYDSYPFPLPPDVEMVHPLNVYRRVYGESQEGYSLDEVEHEYRIMYVDDE